MEIANEDFTVFSGMVVSGVRASEKGVGMKVFCNELRDVYRLFIPAEDENGHKLLKGEADLKMGDPVKIHYKDLYPSNGEIRMNVVNVLKGNGVSKKS